MTQRCGLCHWSAGSPYPIPGWVESIQGFLDNQPHPDKVIGVIPCDRRVFEDESWFCVVCREPLAEGHVRLICRYHLADLSSLRGYSEDALDQAQVEAARNTLLDDLIIASDTVMGYDKRVARVVVLSDTSTDEHLYFDVIPVYRFDHVSLQSMGETRAMFTDMSLPEKRRYWEVRVKDFEETAQRLRDEAERVLRSRPGRRRAGLIVDNE